MPKLTIDCDNLRNIKGQLIVQIWDDPEHFKSQESHHMYKVVHKEIDARRMTVVIDDLPAGTYAFAVEHDENHNEKVDRTVFGVPKEGMAFSNNPHMGMRGPDWEEASFTIKNVDRRMQIHVRYWG